MKKAVIIVAILSAGIFTKAQNISIGPTAGFGHSWISGLDLEGKFNAAWNGGLSLIYSTQTNFGIGMDIKYSSEGNKVTYIGEGIPEEPLTTVTRTVDANYIRVPLKLIYFFGKYGSAVRPKIYAGPSFGFFTGGEVVEEVGESKFRSDTKDNIKNFDLGVTAAAGLNFRLAPRTWLNTDLAFYQGFSDISKDGSTQHNGNVGINVGLLVGLSK